MGKERKGRGGTEKERQREGKETVIQDWVGTRERAETKGKGMEWNAMAGVSALPEMTVATVQNKSE